MEPAIIKNGHWQLLIGNTLTIGTSIVYHCDDGYILLGEKILECTRNGSWTHEAPSCIPQQGELSFFQHKQKIYNNVVIIVI